LDTGRTYHNSMAFPASPNRTRVLLSFGCVYIFWGSTYLAMRYGVEVLPTLVLASTRFLLAAPLLLGLSAAFGLKMKPTAGELGRLAVIGVLMLGCGNVSVIWSEQYIPSGLAALLVASIPLYAAVVEMLLPNGEGLPARGWAGVSIGFAGLLLLLWPGLRQGLHGNPKQILAGAVTLGGTLCWTLGSIVSRRSTMRISGFAAAGWQILFGGLFSLTMMRLFGGYHSAQWGRQAWGAVMYLVIFGSTVTYTAYIYLLDHVPVSKVATYAYVNPVIAVVLGAIFLREQLAAVEYAGMAAVLVAVFLVTGAKIAGGGTNVVNQDLAVGSEV
jgi:drug/metabolite transporter (DMT)-like permease